MRGPNCETQTIKKETGGNSTESNSETHVMEKIDAPSNGEKSRDCNSETHSGTDMDEENGEKAKTFNGEAHIMKEAGKENGEKVEEDNGEKTQQCNDGTHTMKEVEEDNAEKAKKFNGETHTMKEVDEDNGEEAKAFNVETHNMKEVEEDNGGETKAFNAETHSMNDVEEENGGNSQQCNDETHITKEMDETTCKYETKTVTSYCRYFATCGGSYLHIYEAQVAGLNKTKHKDALEDESVAPQRPRNGLHVRQVYRDLDENELYYACAFGGRGIGRALGFESMGKFHRDGKTIIIDAKTTEYENGFVRNTGTDEKRNKSRKRPREGADLYHSLGDLSKFDGPQLCFVAGKVRKHKFPDKPFIIMNRLTHRSTTITIIQSGVIKGIDTVRRSLLLTLSGHGDEIYDICFSPANSGLLLSSSKDASLRLWNVETATCVGIFAGETKPLTL